MFNNILIYLALPIGLATGCGKLSTDVGPAGNSNFGSFHNHDEIYDISGGTNRVDYQSSQDAQGEKVWSVVVNGKLFEATENGDGKRTINGYEQTVTQEDKIAVREALQAGQWDNDKMDTIHGLLSMIDSAPEHLPIINKTYENSSPKFAVYGKGKNYDIYNGYQCVKFGKRLTAKWSNKKGRNKTKRILVGDKPRNGYGCMGLCGDDCTYIGKNSFTRDCLNHDACSLVHRSSGGVQDAHCGDEFYEAIDDFAWKGAIAGC
ncbi:MAG: hypothetical protein CMP10_18925 [Zetaproteobacteria bacterium]|nr:hypothetical protein [Pseudobdellovibrionaceae bacterium]